jgi:hypothetical protein
MKRRIENTVIYPHEILWRSAQQTLELIDSNESAREDRLSIQALLTGFLSFEGFINYLGLEMYPDIWKNERQFFSRGDYKGIEGKVAYLFEKLPDIELRKGEEPYQTFKRVKGLRDKLAHPKPFQYTKTFEIECDDDHYPDFSSEWKEFEEKKIVQDALEKLKELAEILRSKAGEVQDDYYKDHLFHKAFEGPLGSTSAETQSING